MNTKWTELKRKSHIQYKTLDINLVPKDQVDNILQKPFDYADFGSLVSSILGENQFQGYMTKGKVELLLLKADPNNQSERRTSVFNEKKDKPWDSNSFYLLEQYVIDLKNYVNPTQSQVIIPQHPNVESYFELYFKKQGSSKYFPEYAHLIALKGDPSMDDLFDIVRLNFGRPALPVALFYEGYPKNWYLALTDENDEIQIYPIDSSTKQKGTTKVISISASKEALGAR